MTRPIYIHKFSKLIVCTIPTKKNEDGTQKMLRQHLRQDRGEVVQDFIISVFFVIVFYLHYMVNVAVGQCELVPQKGTFPQKNSSQLKASSVSDLKATCCDLDPAAQFK